MQTGMLKLALVTIGALVTALPATAQVQERTIRWGHLNNTDHPVSFGVQKFAEVLAAKSGGKLKVREFPASQLGNEMQQQSAVRGGTQEMFSASTTSLASVVKELGLFDFPFIVATFDQADGARRGSLRQGHDGCAAREGPDRARLLGLGFPQRHQRKPSDREGRGFRRSEASRHPESGLSGDVQGLQGEPGADERSESSTPRSRTRRSTARKIPTASFSRTSSTKCRSTCRRRTTRSPRTSSS